MTNVVYEDDEIIVFFRFVNNYFLLITFNDMMFSATKENKFFADTPIRNLNISVVGIVSKKQNWFPKKYIYICHNKIKNIIDKFDKIIMYGASMGGYAAIKHSKVFNSNTVISLCPQWSIDENECNFIDENLKKYFQSYMRGMGIKSDEIQGDVFIFVDKLNKLEMFHALQIQKRAKNVYLINVPLVGHNVTPVLSGTDSLRKIINYCMNRDVISLSKHSREKRKTSFYYIESIIKRKIKKKFYEKSVLFLLKKITNLNYRWKVRKTPWF